MELTKRIYEASTKEELEENYQKAARTIGLPNKDIQTMTETLGDK